MNDFSNEGGGTIRMLGIINELIERDNEVIFVSNTNLDNRIIFNSKIKHVFIDYPFSKNCKRIFQALLGFLPVFIVNIIFNNFLKKLITILREYTNEDYIYFFEYLDNSIGYWLKSNDLIKGYINDIHGVATLEFKFQARLAKKISDNIRFYTKYFISILLDNKVFNNASGLIFASNTMKKYFEDQYPSVVNKKNYILPYRLSSKSCIDVVDNVLRELLIEKFSIKSEEKIILFAGSFKKTGGVPDLIKAFSNINSTYENCRLFLIGDGPTMDECIEIVKKNKLNHKIVFIGRIPYRQLRTYQNLANIIVCPDKQNVYSDLIIHVKYLDALVSGKIVINGSFKSVLELNINESLSIDFKPSDIVSLTNSLDKCINEYVELCYKYRNNQIFACRNLTYKTCVEILEKK